MAIFFGPGPLLLVLCFFQCGTMAGNLTTSLNSVTPTVTPANTTRAISPSPAHTFTQTSKSTDRTKGTVGHTNNSLARITEQQHKNTTSTQFTSAAGGSKDGNLTTSLNSVTPTVTPANTTRAISPSPAHTFTQTSKSTDRTKGTVGHTNNSLARITEQQHKNTTSTQFTSAAGNGSENMNQTENKTSPTPPLTTSHQHHANTTAAVPLATGLSPTRSFTQTLKTTDPGARNVTNLPTSTSKPLTSTQSNSTSPAHTSTIKRQTDISARQCEYRLEKSNHTVNVSIFNSQAQTLKITVTTNQMLACQ
ncbi:mucin-2-like [Myxocyprinus asiaticus]|uniref:mucin-2-like n=1 Tax=Myxocyprinus asiaticus TaxID=70543 RepID=UPI002221E921|nr:mucin-2-like [Myxocyprinus asiaticus]